MCVFPLFCTLNTAFQQLQIQGSSAEFALGLIACVFLWSSVFSPNTDLWAIQTMLACRSVRAISVNITDYSICVPSEGQTVLVVLWI